MSDSQSNNKPPFPTDFNEELYSIKIIATKGGHKWEIGRIGENPQPTYQEVIGTLEIIKQRTIWEQIKSNETVAEEFLKSEKTE